MFSSTPALCFGLLVALVLNEVLYDPDGSDGDREFVELYNSARVVASLDGIELWFRNGASPEAARLVWSGEPDAFLPAQGYWVVGEAEVAAADAVATLDLQNGPESLELRRYGEVIDAVAWGEGAPPAEGAPAVDAVSTSIGRVPDGRDRNDNSLDFVALALPSPGATNLRENAFEVLALEASPVWRPTPGTVRWRADLRAVGWGQEQRLALRFDDQPSRQFAVLRTDTLSVEWTEDVGSGRSRRTLEVCAKSAPCEERAIEFQVGPVEWVLTEVMPRPEVGAPEWVELLCRDALGCRLAGWALADALGVPRSFDDDRTYLSGERVVVVSDASRWVGALPPSPLVELPGGLPSLNDTGDGDFADRLDLLDPSRVVVDRVEWTEKQLPKRGQGLERAPVDQRSPSMWLPAPNPTPGAPNGSEALVLPHSGFSAGPDPFSPDGDGVDDLLQLALVSPLEAVEADVLDLAGERVCRLAAAEGGDVTRWQWDGRDARGVQVPGGAYVVVVRGSEGGRVRLWRKVIGLGRRH